jgi:hypothetical protein
MFAKYTTRGSRKNIITWFLVKCTITGAFVKYTNRGNMALGSGANNTDS